MFILWIATMFAFVLAGSKGQEWSCSSSASNFDDRMLSYLERDLNETEVPLDSDSNLIIFSVPTRLLNCSGEVTAVEFHYTGLADEVRFGTAYQLFSLLTIEQNNLTLEIRDVIEISATPSNTSCTNQSTAFSSILNCHGSMQLQEDDRFSVPESNFAIGIVLTSSTVRLTLHQPNSILETQVQQLSLPISALGIPAVGQSITPSELNTTMEAIPLLHFVMTPTADEGTDSSTPTLAIYIGIAVGGSVVVILITLVSAIACMAHLNSRKSTPDSSEMPRCLSTSQNKNTSTQQTKEMLHHQSFEARITFPRLQTDAHSSVAFSSAIPAEFEDLDNIYDHLRPAKYSIRPGSEAVAFELDANQDGKEESEFVEQFYINRVINGSGDDPAHRLSNKNLQSSNYNSNNQTESESIHNEQPSVPIHTSMPNHEASSAPTKEDDHADTAKHESLYDDVTVSPNKAYGVTAEVFPDEETVVSLPNPAYGVTCRKEREVESYGCVNASTKSQGHSSDTDTIFTAASTNQTQRASDVAKIDIDDSIYVNTISEVLDHVETLPNQAYGIVTEGRIDDCDYDDIITEEKFIRGFEQSTEFNKGSHDPRLSHVTASHNPRSSRVTVSPNEAYGVLQAQEKDGGDYDDILPGASGSNPEFVATAPNEAYSVFS